MWYCFGCSEGGDSFKFLEKIENLSFAEALDRLANIAGITLTSKRESPDAQNHRDKLYSALEAAATYYQQSLAQSPVAKQYLLNRGILPDTQASFRLGFAPDSSDGLLNFLRKSGVQPADAIEAGVLGKSDRQFSSPYDRLRGRVICPILDVHERPIAFGGRLMEDVKGYAKYLNTAETALFSKGRTFYAMSRARKSLGELEFALVAEGYFDVISAHQAGFTNVVATLGTALTDDHADVLSRLVGRVVLAFDSDPAGYQAAQRANAIFENKGFEVQVLNMPRGEDPDSLLRAGRVSEFQRAINDAVPIREFQLESLLQHYQSKVGLNERDKEAVFRRQIIPLLRATSSVIERERYIRLCAPLHPLFDQGSALAEDQIRQEITAAAPGSRPGRGMRPEDGRRSSGAGNQATNSRVRPGMQRSGSAPTSSVRVAEENLLRAMIDDDKTFSKMIEAGGLTAEAFISPDCRELAQRMLSGNAIAALMEAATRDSSSDDGEDVKSDSAGLARLAARLLAGGDQSGQAPLNGAVVSDSIYRLQRESQASDERDLRVRVEQGDEAAARELMQLLRRQHSGTGQAAGAVYQAI